MVFRRKQREMSELQRDPYFPFYVGRLVGAAEMTSHWLQLQPGGDSTEMGRRLSTVVGWFLTDQPAPLDPYQHTPLSKETTAVIPPKP